MTDPGDAAAPAGNRGGCEINLQGYRKPTAPPPPLGPTACRVLDARRERPWPDLTAYIDYHNRRAMVARAAAHLAHVALSPEFTSRDVQAAVGRLLPLIEAVER